MKSILDKEVLMANIDAPASQPENNRAATIAIALVEIREAIEAIARDGRGVDEHLLDKVNALEVKVKELEQWSIIQGAQLNKIAEQDARLAALEQSVQSVIDHQGETAKLLTALAEKIDK
jgi:hypothetical protein